MRVIQVSYDTILITLILDEFDLQLIVNSINQYDNSLFIKDNKVYIKWDETYTEECRVTDVTNNRGIIQFESH